MQAEASGVTAEPVDGPVEMDFQQVGRTRRRSDLSSPGSDQADKRNRPDEPSLEEDELTLESLNIHIVYLKGRDFNLALLRPKDLMKELTDQFSTLSRIELAGQSLRVYCQSASQKKKLLGGGIIAGKTFVATEPFARAQRTLTSTVKTYRVVIGGVSTLIPDEDILEASGAKQVHRILKKDGGDGKTPTLTVILTYDCYDDAPCEIRLDYMKFKTRPYVSEPMRCFRCQKFNHRSNQCRSAKQVCSLCTGDHKFQDCTSRDNLKCVNCGQNHSSADKTCSKYTAIRATLKVVATTRVSYRDAVLIQKAASSAVMPVVQQVSGNPTVVRTEPAVAPAVAPATAPAVVPRDTPSRPVRKLRVPRSRLTLPVSLSAPAADTVRPTTSASSASVPEAIQAQSAGVKACSCVQSQAGPAGWIPAERFVAFFIKMMQYLANPANEGNFMTQLAAMAAETMGVSTSFLGTVSGSETVVA